MDDLTPRQKKSVQPKYEAVYGAMARATQAVIADPTVPADAKFMHLKDLLAGVWGAVIALNVAGARPEWSDILAHCEAYKTKPSEWLERGVPKTGTQQRRDESVDRVFLETMHRYLPQECDLILDLGCGWGHRMFDLWRSGGPKDALYVGGDRSPYTRDVISRVSTLFPGMKVGWFPFDFLNPDFNGLPDRFQRVVVYSFHAIEQVAVLGPALLEQLTAQFPAARIRGIHLEPIGFQFDHTDLNAAQTAEAVRAWAESRNYNMDFVAQVRANPKIKLAASENAILTREVTNTTSVLVWDKV